MNHRKWKAGHHPRLPLVLSTIWVEIVWEGKSQSVYISTGRPQKRDMLPAVERNVQSGVTNKRGKVFLFLDNVMDMF